MAGGISQERASADLSTSGAESGSGSFVVKVKVVNTFYVAPSSLKSGGHKVYDSGFGVVVDP